MLTKELYSTCCGAEEQTDGSFSSDGGFCPDCKDHCNFEAVCTECTDFANNCECAYAIPGLAPTWAEITTVFAVVVMLATLAVAGGR